MIKSSTDGQNENSDLGKYVAVMKEIKLRLEVVDAFLSGQTHAIYSPTNIETVGLQFRKIFELVAFASLSANKKEYSSVYADFSKHWEAAKLLRILQRINPDFYPKPVGERKSGRPDILHNLDDRHHDYLTQAELVEAHGRCGKLLHAANPFGAPIDYEFFQAKYSIWRTRLINLLSNHKVHLVGDTGFYLIHMFEEKKGREVSWYRFDLVGPIISESKSNA